MFLLSKTYRSGREATQPPTRWVVGKSGWDISLDHSPPFNAEVKNECGCTSSHPTCRLGVDTDNFTSTFLQVQLHDEVGMVVTYN